MRNLEFVVTKQNNLDAIRYNLGIADVYDDRTADKAASLGNIVPFQYIDVDGKRSVTSYVHDEISLETMLKEVLDKKGVYAIVGGLASVFEIGAQGIPVSYIIRDTNYVFVNKESFAVKGMLVPLKQDIVQLSEIPAFFREVVSKMRFNEMDTDNYVARLFNVINSDDFSASKLKAYVDHQLEMMGLYISRDYGLMGTSAGGMTTGNRGIRVNKLGVMQQSAMRQPQMMQGMPPMMGQPQMPQGMPPMMGQPQIPQGMPPMMGQPQMPQGVPPMMGQPQMPQGMPPMMGQPQMPQGMPPMMGQPQMPQMIQPIEVPEEKPQEEVKIEENIEEKIEENTENKIEETVEKEEAPQMMPEPEKQPDLEVPQPAMATDNKATTSELPAIQEENEKYAIEAGIIKPDEPEMPKPVAPQATVMQNVATMAPSMPMAPVPAQTPPIAPTSLPEGPKPVEIPPSPFAPNPARPAGMPGMPSSNMPAPNPRPTISTPIMANSAMPVEDFNPGETTVLGSDQMMPAGISGQLGMKPIPHIVRKKTGEVINITKTNFTIGKSQTKTDYAVTDNPAVSRVHCIIIQRDGVNFIKDNNSTNHTYINGVELQPGKEMLLKNKTVIQLGDEEFTFLLRKGE